MIWSLPSSMQPTTFDHPPAARRAMNDRHLVPIVDFYGLTIAFFKLDD